MNRALLISLFCAFFLILWICLFNVAIAGNNLDENYLLLGSIVKGKNSIFINRTILVSDLIALNPSIESISFIDKKTNKTIGYANIFGGVGENFQIVPGQEYEISSARDAVLKIWRS